MASTCKALNLVPHVLVDPVFSVTNAHVLHPYSMTKSITHVIDKKSVGLLDGKPMQLWTRLLTRRPLLGV